MEYNEFCLQVIDAIDSADQHDELDKETFYNVNSFISSLRDFRHIIKPSEIKVELGNLSIKWENTRFMMTLVFTDHHSEMTNSLYVEHLNSGINSYRRNVSPGLLVICLDLYFVEYKIY